MTEKFETITLEEIKDWTGGGWYTTQKDMRDKWLLDILTGKYDLKEAREDILSFRK